MTAGSIARATFDVDVFFHGQVCGRFGLDTSAAGRLGFHVVVSGSCWVHASALSGPRKLMPGDVVLFGRSVPHVVSHASHSTDLRDPESIVALGSRAGPPATGLVCGYFEARDPVTSGWLEALPDCCVVAGSECPSRWSLALAKLMVHEVAACREEGDRLTTRVAELFLSMCAREHCEAEDDGATTLGARREPRLRKVLDAIDADLAHRWTVSELAGIAGVSRAKFAAWFARELGSPPITYLRRQRMRAAERLARCGEVPVAVLARRAGYRSVSAFRQQYEQATGHRITGTY